MSNLEAIRAKVFPLHSDSSTELVAWLNQVQRPLVFTNGCFDILHRGHITYLAQAADLGQTLIVGVNDDMSVRAQNKGSDRPLNPLEDRMAILAALQSVDRVIPYSELTPAELIRLIRPDVLVKGGDWALDQIVGADDIKSWGGSVHSIAFSYQRSTSNLLKQIRNS